MRLTAVTHWQTWERRAVFCLSRIRNFWPLIRNDSKVNASIYCWSETTNSEDWPSKLQPWNFFHFFKKVKVVKAESQNMLFFKLCRALTEERFRPVTSTWVSPCRKWPNTQENGCQLPHSAHIHRWYLFLDQPRPVMGNDWSSPSFA